MSQVKLGKVAPFPPLPGQPYPPARNHPRWKELYRLHDEWIQKYWPFNTEKKRARVPFWNLAGFSTWCAPAADFDRMVWGGRIAGIFFLADDYVDNGRMLDRIPGFKKAATGEGPLHPDDQAEICHDVVFRAIKATSHPRTFEQLTACTHEWWDSNIHEPFQNLDQYLSVRRVNIAMYFANAYFRYTLDINLPDEQVNHPLMREAEGIVSDHVGLTNDYFSYLKEKLTNSDDTNVIRILMDHEKLSYEEASEVIKRKILQKEQDFIKAGMDVLNDPELGKHPEVRRWIACLPYCMGGNKAWSQESGRYNVGDIPGEVPFPSLPCAWEGTPEDEIVDDTEESMLRDKIFNIDNVPAPDFTLDDDPVTATNQTGLYRNPRPIPRPADVGIIGLEVYFPKRCISLSALEAFDGVPKGEYTTEIGQQYLAFTDDHEDINSFALSAVSSLMKKYKIDPKQVGRLDVGTETMVDQSRSVTATLMELFAVSGNHDIEGVSSQNSTYGSTAALFNAINWVESSSWDGRYAVVFTGDTATHTEGSARPLGGAGAVAMLVGPNAPLVVERTHGSYMANTYDFDKSHLRSEYPGFTAYLTALDHSYRAYKRKYSNYLSADAHAGFHADTREDKGEFREPIPAVRLSDFDYTAFHSPYGKVVQKAHARLMYHDFIANPGAPIFRNIPKSFLDMTLEDSLKDEDIEKTFIQLAASKYDTLVNPSLLIANRCGNTSAASLYASLASLLTLVPSYEIFDKRIAMFAYGSGCASSFFAIRVKGDTSCIASALDLKARLAAMVIRPCTEYVEAVKLREENLNSVEFAPNGFVNNLWPGAYYLKAADSKGRRSYSIYDGKPVPRVHDTTSAATSPKDAPINSHSMSTALSVPQPSTERCAGFAQMFSLTRFLRRVLAI